MPRTEPESATIPRNPPGPTWPVSSEVDPARVKITVRRVTIDGGGYTRGGTYFGRGAPLWNVTDYHGDVDYHVRATDRTSARAKVRALYPNCTFGR